jgi:hypothetical protein
MQHDDRAERGHRRVPSLARAFVVAGVPAVVGMLWEIDDANAAPAVVGGSPVAAGLGRAAASRTSIDHHLRQFGA